MYFIVDPVQEDEFIIDTRGCQLPNIMPLDKRYPQMRSHNQGMFDPRCGRGENNQKSSPRNLTMLVNGFLQFNNVSRYVCPEHF